jgi:hypothetical protein
MVPVSTAISDPIWYRPPQDKEYYIDKRGIVCGLRYKPLIVQLEGAHTCPCEDRGQGSECPTMKEYSELLNTLVNKEKTLKAFEYCANKFQKELGFKEEPIIVLMVYETPKNPCSERYALQKFFDCDELEYPIKNI